MTLQPDAMYMQGKRTESAFFMVPVGTQVTSARWAKSEPRTASRAQRCVHDKCLLKSYSRLALEDWEEGIVQADRTLELGHYLHVGICGA